MAALAAACSSGDPSDTSAGASEQGNTLDELAKRGNGPRYEVWRTLRAGKQSTIDAYVAAKSDQFKSFKNAPVGKSGVPMIMIRLMPELFPEIWGAPSQGMEKVGFTKDSLEPARVLPLGLGFMGSDTIVPTPAGNVAINVVTLTCGGCHEGRVLDAGGNLKIIHGAPNTRFDGFRSAVLRTVNHPGYTADAFRAALAAKPMGWVYGDPALGQQEYLERAVFASPGAAENFLGQLKARSLAGAIRMQQTLGAYTYHGQEWRLGAFKPGYLDAISVGVLPLLDPATMPADQLQAALPPAPAEIDITSVWNQWVRPLAQWDGSIKNRLYRNLAAEVGVVGNGTQVNLSNAVKTTDFTDRLPSAPYPFDIDWSKAQRGSALYAKYCVSCHTAMPELISGRLIQPALDINSKLYELADVGTDPNRALLFQVPAPGTTNLLEDGLRGLLKQACDGNQQASCNGVSDADILAPTRKYLAPPLDGIWARAPYLHNGSVPTLYHLLVPSARPAKFQRGNLAYDQAKVGFVYDTASVGSAEYDTSLSGLSNRGHNSPKYLKIDWAKKPAETADLLEFLKVL